MKMEWFITYDISDNDLRNQAANICKNYGLERVQYSVFYGITSKNKIEEIALKLKTLTINNNANILIIPNCEACKKKQIIIINEQPPQKKHEKNKKQKQKQKREQDQEQKKEPKQNNTKKTKPRKKPTKPKDELEHEKKQTVLFA